MCPMKMDFEQFEKLAREYNLIPLFDEMPADLDTPVSAFLKLKTGDYDFLFESVVGGEKWARYSFLGSSPKKIFTLQDGEFQIRDRDGSVTSPAFQASPLEILREHFNQYSVYQDASLPRFFGGMVGYFGYDLVHYFEKIPPSKSGMKNNNLADLFLILTDTVVIFDNFQQVMKIVNSVYLPDSVRKNKKELKKYYQESFEKISKAKKKLQCAVGNTVHKNKKSQKKECSIIQSTTEAEFCKKVIKAKKYIEAGDIFQVVPSLRFQMDADQIDSFQVYRSLRRVNPSPYMYYLHLKDVTVVGASPEVLVRLEDDRIEVRPIAGTRKRGLDEKEDQALETELKNDPKERAEHIMLVDLGRNDVGRVAATGSIRVDENEVIERYSHVMHLVSHVSGKLSDDKDVFDVIQATFPAGTLTGAPKIRAMQIIDELEDHSRGIYGGAIGYISFTKNTDLAITIRTAVFQNSKIVVQAGAGIVYNSVPKLEYKECCNKAKAMIQAIQASTVDSFL